MTRMQTRMKTRGEGRGDEAGGGGVVEQRASAALLSAILLQWYWDVPLLPDNVFFFSSDIKILIDNCNCMIELQPYLHDSVCK